jgi:hypothetical protein
MLKFGPFSALFAQSRPKFGRRIVRSLHFLFGTFFYLCGRTIGQLATLSFKILGCGEGGAEQRLNCLVHVPVVDVRLLEMEVVAHGDEQVGRLLEALHLIIHQASEQPQHLRSHTRV